MDYVIADTHFYHDKVLEFEESRKQFVNMNHMVDTIISNIRKTCNKSDTLYVLGDFSFGSREQNVLLISRIRCNKVLIIGNHDRRKSVKYWHDVGFNWVSKFPIMINNVILSHEPVFCGLYNIHGHLHHKTVGDELHKCVSVEHTNFHPIQLEI